MIFKSISLSLKRQDWTALFLEFVLIVVGILVALEAGNWNNERRNAIEEKIYVARLIEALDETILNNSKVIAQIQKNVENLETAYFLLVDDTLSDTNIPLFNSAFSALDSYSYLRNQNNVLSEMVATGKVQLISSDDIRLAVSSYHNKINNDVLVGASHFDVFLQLRIRTHNAVRLIPTDTSEEVVRATVPELLANEELKNILSFSTEMQSVQLNLINSFDLKTKELKQSLNAHLEVISR